MKRQAKGAARFIRHLQKNDSLGLAAKTAFFFLLSLFPLMLLAGWALSYTGQTLDVLEGFLPGDLIPVFEEIERPAAFSNPVLIVSALWAASSGVWALMKGIHQAYTGGKLPFVRARWMAVGFTLGFITVLALTLAFVATDRWPVTVSVAGVIFLLLFALYTLTPGTSAKPTRALWTAALATAAWIGVSRAFEGYMRYFARYDALYGGIGAFMGIAIWVFLICVVIILGAELGAL